MVLFLLRMVKYRTPVGGGSLIPRLGETRIVTALFSPTEAPLATLLLPSKAVPGRLGTAAGPWRRIGDSDAVRRAGERAGRLHRRRGRRRGRDGVARPEPGRILPGRCVRPYCVRRPKRRRFAGGTIPRPPATGGLLEPCPQPASPLLPPRGRFVHLPAIHREIIRIEKSVLVEIEGIQKDIRRQGPRRRLRRKKSVRFVTPTVGVLWGTVLEKGSGLSAFHQYHLRTLSSVHMYTIINTKRTGVQHQFGPNYDIFMVDTHMYGGYNAAMEGRGVAWLTCCAYREDKQFGVMRCSRKKKRTRAKPRRRNGRCGAGTSFGTRQTRERSDPTRIAARLEEV